MLALPRSIGDDTFPGSLELTLMGRSSRLRFQGSRLTLTDEDFVFVYER